MNDRQTHKTFFSALDGIRRRVKLVLAGLALNFFTLAVLAQTASPFNLPLYFEANKDQTEFLSRGNGYEFLISATGAQIALRDAAARPAAVQMQFPGAKAHAEIRGDGELPGKINYLIGNDPARWQTGLPTFSRVQIAEIYPGINLVFHGNQNQLEYDFAIAPGANPGMIKIRFAGVDKISLTPQGGLVLKIGAGEFCQSAPDIYQTIGEVRKTVAGGYKLLDARTVAFEIGGYDRSLPLVIDPVLNYSAFFGGNLNTEAWAIALCTNSSAGATNGSIYIAGETLAQQFSTPGVVQTNFAGGVYIGDGFIAKFTNPATNLVYLTYLGGNGEDVVSGLAVDAAGNAFVAGGTSSTNFPIVNALYTNIPSVYSGKFRFQPASGFVAELNPSGTNLVYSTYLGGSSQNLAESIAIDSADNAYVVGYTYSTNFPVTTNALQKLFLGTNNTTFLNYNAFVTEIASNDANLVYSTYLGGTNADVAESVAVDSSNNVYVAGVTASFNFPVWNEPANLPEANHLNGATNQYFDGNFDAFVTKLPPLSGTILPSTLTNAFYSTFLGGTNSDGAYGVAADASGCAYVTGWTCSTNFLVLYPNPSNSPPPGLFSYLATNGLFNFGITNAFLTKIAANGSMVDYSAVFGGAGDDNGYKVAVDSAGNAFVIGSETSTNFPVANTFGPLGATNSSQFNNLTIGDVFVTALNTNCSAVLYSVLLGGSYTASFLGNSSGYGIALDAADNAYLTGQTSATNFPVQNAPTFSLIGTNFDNGAFLNGTNNAFLSEILFTPGTPIVLVAPTNQTVGVGANVSFTIIATNTTPLLYQWQSEVFTNIMGTNVPTGIFTNLINGGNIGGVYNNVLTITNVTTNNAGAYSVIVSYGGTGTITTNATLTVTLPPLIFTPLTNQTVGLGVTVTFAMTALGQPPLNYSWQYNGTNLANGGRISGAATNTLILTGTKTNDSGTYEVTVTNAFGLTNSSAILTVLSAPIASLTLVSNNFTNGLLFNLVGGSNGGSFHAFFTTNLLMPITNSFGNASFDSQGRFSQIITGLTNPEEFFRFTEP